MTLRAEIHALQAQTHAIRAETSELQSKLRRYMNTVGASTPEEAEAKIAELIANSSELERKRAQLRRSDAEAQAAADVARREQLCRHGRALGKLTPALEAFYAARPTEDLERYLHATAPHSVIPRPVTQPKLRLVPHPHASARELSDEAQAWKDMKPAQLAALKQEDPYEYNRLRKAAQREGLIP